MSDERRGIISASALGQLAKCNKSGQLQKGIAGTTSKEAAAGDVMHDACSGKDVALTPDEADLVRKIKEHETTVRMLVFGTDPIYETKREIRLWSRTKKFSGRADVVMIDGGTALIIDYKTGRIPVDPAKNNWQLKGYAVLVSHNWPVNRVFVSIIQPHCGEPTIYKYDKDELRKASRQVHALIRKANGDKAKLNPGESQCKYCRAKPICPALQSESLELARVSEDGVTRYTGGQLSLLLDRCKPVEDFIKQLREQARKMIAANDDSVPNYKLVKGNRRRKIADNKQVYSVLADNGIPFDDILNVATFSVAKIERLARLRDDLSAGEARSLVEDALGGLIETTESDPRLEREEDAKQNSKG